MHTPRELRRVAVIGAGSAGLDFAARCVRSGFQVTLEDVMPSRLRHAKQWITSPGDPSETASSSRIGSDDGHAGTLRLASTVEDAVRDADLAIDFVPDELESKLEIFSMLDRMAPPHTILCTPTTLSIADLASCTYRPQLCFALRFATPESADLIHTSRSAADVLAATERWLQQLGLAVTASPDPEE
ncbi:MAG TPA: 3-hydroxyacyl-CoA dehydrogenase NAD-binding domain-containing protein [Candidatus Aquilonibacter sp.]|nr:3-hydroxyacyl-CoA dehydrogenase NAD-binding domain-containing protein [Candidatus Aquilonibacter sp.]